MIDTLPTTAAPVEPVTPIRPSEALRLGRLLRPREITGTFFDGTDGACALGAISLGGVDWFDIPCDNEPCPVGCRMRPGEERRISHLNDVHRWSTERIGSWLESLGL